MGVTVTVTNKNLSTDDLSVNLIKGMTAAPTTKTLFPGEHCDLVIELEDEISIMRRPRIMK